MHSFHIAAADAELAHAYVSNARVKVLPDGEIEMPCAFGAMADQRPEILGLHRRVVQAVATQLPGLVHRLHDPVIRIDAKSAKFAQDAVVHGLPLFVTAPCTIILPGNTPGDLASFVVLHPEFTPGAHKTGCLQAEGTSFSCAYFA